MITDSRRANAHIHLPPNFSAFETVGQAVDLASAQGLAVLGASNYYDYTVYSEFAALAESKRIYPLFGIEIIALIPELQAAGIKLNDPGNPGKMYICGKGISRFKPMSEAAAALLQVIRDKDSARMTAMTEALGAIFDGAGLKTGLDEAAIKARIVRRHGCPPETLYLQERHLAQAFQEALFEMVSVQNRPDMLERLFSAAPTSHPDDSVGIQNEIRLHLMKAGKPAYVEETFVDFDHAYQLILALGGMPCYPVLADGARRICSYEEDIDRLIENTKSRGVLAAEFIPIRNTPEVLSHYVSAMRGAGLVVTAGTEHNTLDLLPMEPTCLNGEPTPAEIKDIFWEGACVVAGNQEARARGTTGYMDSLGRLNPDFTRDADRIEAFRVIGEAAILECARN